MACMKCGKDVNEPQVFCDECLAVMERYPVKPGTAIQLPKRQPRAKKIVRQTPLTEVVAQQKTTIRRMAWTIAVLFVALCLVSGFLYLKIYADAGVLTPETIGATQSESTTGTTQ